ncbi:MAG: gamma-glutamyltransferase family protein [Planctomycetota bacterium]
MQPTNTGSRGGRPQILATHAVVTSGHYLASNIGLDILKKGGNAFDAAAAVGFALTVLKPHQCGFGGEAPVLFRAAGESSVHALSGHGVAPAAATLEYFQSLDLDRIPGDGFLGAVVPPVPATWLALLERHGSLRLKEILLPVADLAQDGFPMYDSLHAAIAQHAARFREQWPSSAKKFLPHGAVPPIGTVFKQPDLAATFRRLIVADQDAGTDRIAGLRAAHDRFYRGDIARHIVDFARTTPVRDASGRAHTALLTAADFAGCEAHFEAPLAVDWHGWTVHKCSSWTQGPVFLQTLRLLEGCDLKKLGHNSADYLHTLIEALKLAFADREFFYGDPAHVAVPFDRLLSSEYAAERRRLIDPARASLDQRPGRGAPFRAQTVLEANAAYTRAAGSGRATAGPTADAETDRHGDTTKLEVADQAGNLVSATPSGGWLMSSPVVPGYGFPLGTRGQMFSLEKGHPNCVAPGKRPRTTLTTAIARHEDGRFMSFGSPGGEGQEVWGLQFFLNVVEFGMSLQQAIEAPTVAPIHWPSSFYPRGCEPGGVNVEDRIDPAVRAELTRRGHLLHVLGPFSGGNTLAALIDPVAGVLHAAASPRLDPAYAIGW